LKVIKNPDKELSKRLDRGSVFSNRIFRQFSLQLNGGAIEYSGIHSKEEDI
jgi:hypothetical protein